MGKILDYIAVKLSQAAMPKGNDSKGKGGKHEPKKGKK